MAEVQHSLTAVGTEDLLNLCPAMQRDETLAAAVASVTCHNVVYGVGWGGVVIVQDGCILQCWPAGFVVWKAVSIPKLMSELHQ